MATEPIADEPVIAYRLFRKEEIDQLGEFLLKQAELKNQFPDYPKWIRKIIPQIIGSAEKKNEIGNWRLAFGLFKGIPKEETTLNKKIIGSALINLSTSNSVELKSFFICPEDRKHSYSYKLFDMVHTHCAKHGIRKIETSVSSSDIATISIFLRQGYKVINEEDIYLIGQPRIRMQKKLLPFFEGDPFDWEQICFWFITNYLKAYNIEQEEKELNFKLDLSNDGVTDFKQDIQISNCTNNSCFRLTLNCRAYVLTKCDINELKQSIDKSKKEKKDLTIYLIKEIDESEKKYLDKNQLIYFDERKICSDSGKLNLPSYSKRDIGGMIVELKENYYNHITNKKNFVYYKGAKIGHNLRQHSIIFFFVLPSKNEIKGEIMGYGYLKTPPTIGNPEKEWQKNSGKAILEKEDFNQFTQNKERIMTMQICDFKHITPIKFNAIIQSINFNLEPEDLHQYYLDKKTTKALIAGYQPLDGFEDNNLKIVSSFVKHCDSRSYSAFWTKKKEIKKEPENIAKTLLTSFLDSKFYTYEELLIGNGFVDILARERNEQDKHILLELKINNGPSYLKKGVNRLKEYINKADTYNIMKQVYFIIFNFTDSNTAKNYHLKKIRYKDYKIIVFVISLPRCHE
ncbi:MAG: hypothetical protein V1859_11475 [archaeon]